MIMLECRNMDVLSLVSSACMIIFIDFYFFIHYYFIFLFRCLLLFTSLLFYYCCHCLYHKCYFYKSLNIVLFCFFFLYSLFLCRLCLLLWLNICQNEQFWSLKNNWGMTIRNTWVKRSSYCLLHLLFIQLVFINLHI